MRLQYRTIKDPPDTGRVTLEQAELAVRALQQNETSQMWEALRK